MRLKIFNNVVLILAVVLSAFAQTETVKISGAKMPSELNPGFFPLRDVRAGMIGTAKTVFSGNDAEPFDVEILGVLPNGIGPKQDLILGTISGGKSDRTKVFAGMSGSPVYIDGKLVGAISYAFPFSTEAICGITPISQMVSIFEQSQSSGSKYKSPKKYSFSELAAAVWEPDFAPSLKHGGSVSVAGGSGDALSALAGQSFKPIATPLSFNGFSKKTLDAFTPNLLRMGLLPVTGVSGGSGLGKIAKIDENTLVGGDSVAVELVRGDYSIAANGTVTLRDDDRIYAFGHPFLSLGTSSLPMSESSVIVVVPSINNSFKMSVAESLVGSITQDRATGIYGNLGTAPQMIPVTLKLQTSRGKIETLKYEIANDEFLTPVLLNITVFNTITANERGIGSLTISVDGKINLENTAPVLISGRFAGQSSIRLASGSVVVPAVNLVNSKFDDLVISGIELDIQSYDENKTAVLHRITVDRPTVKPGEIVEVEAFIRTDTGKILTQKIPFQIPADTPFGKIKLVVGDGGVMQLNSAEQFFEPRRLADLVETINSLKKSDRLYLQAKRKTAGAIIDSKELPNLPPSVLATLNTGRTSGVFKPTLESIVAEMEIPQSKYIVSGLQEIEIEIVD